MLIVQDIVELMNNVHAVNICDSLDGVTEHVLYKGEVANIEPRELLSYRVTNIACKRGDMGYILNIKVDTGGR